MKAISHLVENKMHLKMLSTKLWPFCASSENSCLLYIIQCTECHDTNIWIYENLDFVFYTRHTDKNIMDLAVHMGYDYNFTHMPRDHDICVYTHRVAQLRNLAHWNENVFVHMLSNIRLHTKSSSNHDNRLGIYVRFFVIRTIMIYIRLEILWKYW